MDSGAQYIIVQRRAPPPCSKVNREQNDKKMLSQVHVLEEVKSTIPFTCSKKSNSKREFHTLCLELSSIFDAVDADEESRSITQIKKKHMTVTHVGCTSGTERTR